MCDKCNFVSLHHHSTHSLNDALATPKQIVERASALGMKAVALTDHSRISGWPELHKAGKELDVKTIFGNEVYFVEDIEGRPEGKGRDYGHLLLLATNRQGYHNITKLQSIAATEGVYYKPRIDYKHLAEYSEGIIVSSACAGSFFAEPLKNGDPQEAEKRIRWFVDLFGKERFYLELQRHDSTAKDILQMYNPWLEQMAKKYDIKMLVTNDSHYLCQNDWASHEVALAKLNKSKIVKPGANYFYDQSFYFKNEDEMLALFPDHTDAVYRTGDIADMVEDYDPVEHHYNFPQAKIEDKWITEDEAGDILRERSEARLKVLGKYEDKVYIDRLNEELTIITKFKFSNYLLVMADILEWGRINNIPVGPGRGSAAGSLINYLLKITILDPIEYKLSFARFLNEGRMRKNEETGEITYSSMIDIDSDISMEQRTKFLEYVQSLYGNVYHIGTDGRYSAKSALKTVGSAYGIPFGMMNSFTQIIQSNVPGTNTLVSIDSNMEKEHISEFVKVNNLKEVVDVARGLEGCLEKAGVHASAFVVSRNPIDSIVPIKKVNTTNLPVIDINMEGLESHAKQIKIDLLGLRNLDLIHNAEQSILARFKDAKLPEWGDFSDDTVFDAKYGLDNIFQFGSSTAYTYYKKINPSTIQELSDLSALLRPGALMSGQADLYAGGGRIHKILALNEALKETRGIMVYQEQTMEVAKIVAGFSDSKADDLRKAIGKKKIDEMKKVLEEFKTGATSNGFLPQDIEYIIQQIMDSALYSFNKSHSICYAAISYKCLWLKHYYPVEFYCAVLNTLLSGGDSKLQQVIKDAISNGISILPPSINESSALYTVRYNEDGSSNILTGLSGIKGVGEAAINTIMEMRPFITRNVEVKTKTGTADETWSPIEDYLARIPKKKINSQVKQAIAKSGALDCLCDRNTAMSYAEERHCGYSDTAIAFMEKDVLGMFFTCNPYMMHECFKRRDIFKPSDVASYLNEGDLAVVGFIEDLTFKTANNNKTQYVTFTLTDGIDYLQCIGFTKVVTKFSTVLQNIHKDRKPCTIMGNLKLDKVQSEDDEEVLDSEQSIKDFKLWINTIEPWMPMSGITAIRVLPEDFDEVLQALPYGTERILLYSLDGKELQIDVELSDNLINLLRRIYNIQVKFKYAKDN